jgi:hypothetical protein
MSSGNEETPVLLLAEAVRGMYNIYSVYFIMIA